jgi:hypothetical protein
MKVAACLAVGLLGLGLWTAPSAAATLTAIYSGTVVASHNPTGEFGRDDLEGFPVRLTFSYRVPPAGSPGRSTDGEQDVLELENLGPGAPYRAEIAINGVTETIHPDRVYIVSSLVDGPRIGHQFEFSRIEDGRQQVRVLSAEAWGEPGDIPFGLEQLFTHGSERGVGSARFLLLSCLVDDWDECITQDQVVFGLADLYSVPVIPLPMALPLFATGLAGLVLLRQRRSRCRGRQPGRCIEPLPPPPSGVVGPARAADAQSECSPR